jgi:hypothetical protein
MTRFPKVLVGCGLALLCCYAVYASAFLTYHIRYKLSLDLDVDGTVQMSSGVVGVDYPIGTDFFAPIGGGRAFYGVFRGNAVTIDLHEHGLLFVVNQMALGDGALRRRGSTSLAYLPLKVFGYPTEGLPSQMAKLVSDLAGRSGSVDVPIDMLPMFVRFRTPSDRTSLEELNPADLASAYGGAVTLLRARLTLTSDAITPIPTSWPKWLIAAVDDPAAHVYNWRRGQPNTPFVVDDFIGKY